MKDRSLPALCLFLCLPCLLLQLALPPGAASRPQAAPLFWGFALEGHPITVPILEQVERDTGLVPHVVVFFLQWPASPGEKAFPAKSIEAIWARGAVPCITWEPMYYENGREITISREKITGGAYDAYIRDFAGEAARWGRPLMIRFAHEMNISRYHWGTEPEAFGPQSPEIYRAMHRHLVTLFREAGADNVLWVFCPNAESVPNTSYDPAAGWNRIENYYPGDRYVDILGMDGYNWGTTRTPETHGWRSHWKSFEEIFTPIYRELKALSPHKPLFVFETASASQGGDKPSWIIRALETLAMWEVQGVVWFQAEKEFDWRINSEADTSYISPVRRATSSCQNWFGRFLRKRTP
ncbi:MAG: endoglucanase [Deltaproteobacteria bacterium]|nr:endoglucanase [Deltaproteobacteria bacterium]